MKPQARKIYETEEDLARELVFKTKVERKWPMISLFKLPYSYGLDWAVTLKNDELTGWAELKCRSCNMNDFSTWIVSRLKWETALAKLEQLEQVFFFVRWKDQDGYLELKKSTIKKCLTKIGGRKDRGDSADVEPVVHVPISLFKVF